MSASKGAGKKPVIQIQDPFLNAVRRERISVSVFLVNGIKLQGFVESFDQYALILRNNVRQMVYKHAISTIVPSRNVDMMGTNEQESDESDELPDSNQNKE